jgi:hypothetical protein
MAVIPDCLRLSWAGTFYSSALSLDQHHFIFVTLAGFDEGKDELYQELLSFYQEKIPQQSSDSMNSFRITHLDSGMTFSLSTVQLL